MMSPDDDVAMTHAPLLRELDGSFAQDVRRRDEPDHLRCLVDDEQRAHAAGDHHLIRLVDRHVAHDGHRVDPSQVGHHLGRRRLEAYRRELAGERQHVMVAGFRERMP
jgi:hypothetical protein